MIQFLFYFDLSLLNQLLVRFRTGLDASLSTQHLRQVAPIDNEPSNRGDCTVNDIPAHAAHRWVLVYRTEQAAREHSIWAGASVCADVFKHQERGMGLQENADRREYMEKDDVSPRGLVLCASSRTAFLSKATRAHNRRHKKQEMRNEQDCHEVLGMSHAWY